LPRLSIGSLLLAGAWLLVLGGLGALAAFALLTAPPPSADPVQVGLPPPPPAVIAAADPSAAVPAPAPEETAEETAGQRSAEAADSPDAESEPTDGADPAQTPDPSGAAPEPASAAEIPAEPDPVPSEAPATDSATDETAAAEDRAPETPAPETPDPETPDPETREPTEPSQQATTPEEDGSAAEGAAPLGSGNAASVTLPQPKPAAPPALTDSDLAATPEAAPNPGPNPGADQQAALPEAEAGTPQSVSVPIIPPAPEDLPYWERFRQPFNTEDQRPRIAVVLTGLGLSDSATQAAIDNLPPAITLSFSPYARGLERWIALARARGHEVMIDLPMEPASFPNDDPGPQALLTSLSAEDNLDRLDWVLSRGSAYVGVAGTMGSRFTASREHMETLLRELKSRGLIFLDNRTTERSVAPALAAEIGLKSAFNNRSIDERQASRVAIDARLAQIERIALSEGSAVAMAQPYPVTLQRLADWSTEVNARGMVIAPISALVGRQESR